MNVEMAKRVALSALLVVAIVLIWSAATANENHPCMLKPVCAQAQYNYQAWVTPKTARTPKYQPKHHYRRGTMQMVRREK